MALKVPVEALLTDIRSGYKKFDLMTRDDRFFFGQHKNIYQRAISACTSRMGRMGRMESDVFEKYM